MNAVFFTILYSGALFLKFEVWTPSLYPSNCSRASPCTCRQGAPWIRPTHMDIHTHSHTFTVSIHTYRQFRVSNLPNLHVFRLWAESGAPRETERVNSRNIMFTHSFIYVFIGQTDTWGVWFTFFASLLLSPLYKPTASSWLGSKY